MSYWICCNSCFHSPSANRKLAVTSCGHVICSVCFQKGSQGICLICKATCKLSPLSDNSSSEVKALFSDINDVATKHFSEISKVVMFQARHQKRLLTHYQNKNEKLEEVLGKMKQEMQQMTKKLNEQSAYIAKLENTLQHHSSMVSSMSQVSHNSQTPQRHTQALHSPFKPLSRQSSMANLSDNMEVDGLFRKPNTVPRLSLISPPESGRMGTISHRSSDRSALTNYSACSATVSRFQGVPLTPDIPSSQISGWKSPIFQLPSSFRHSMSSLVSPGP
ncbi:probable E3 SUMO-protein ligase RNF212 [Xyrichtys novacula]|uniref:Probable E3 SUMO-protein ligase RNF212 n=1 Tax=Xyrichtys novacula TaxID=13765 RepID=A0AAV1FC91_XYRNO|nr:probable E3 SUMO-protein ligase RNF212 [Xyrichtys novacula]